MSYVDLIAHIAEVQRLVGVPVHVNDMLKSEGRVNGAKLWPIFCPSAGPQLLQLSVVDKALYHGAGIEPADGLAI